MGKQCRPRSEGSWRTDRPGQTVKTQIRLLLEDRQAWANSVDPDQTVLKEEQSDQGLHCNAILSASYGITL